MREQEGGWGKALVVLIKRKAELGDVSDFGCQTLSVGQSDAHWGHVCFPPSRFTFYTALISQGMSGVFLWYLSFIGHSCQRGQHTIQSHFKKHIEGQVL